MAYRHGHLAPLITAVCISYPIPSMYSVPLKGENLLATYCKRRTHHFSMHCFEEIAVPNDLYLQ